MVTRTASGVVQDLSAQVRGTLTLRPDGSFTQDLRIGTRQGRRAGSYRVEGEQLLLQGGSGQSATMRFRLKGGKLHLQEDQNGTAIRYGLVSP